MVGVASEAVAVVLYTDSTSATAVTDRPGVGPLRHLAARQLWLQEEVRAGRPRIQRVATSDNISAMLTRGLAEPRFIVLRGALGLRDLAQIGFEEESNGS